MAHDETYVCLFCSSDIRKSDDTTTIPNMGILVHTACYRKDGSDDPLSDDHEAAAA